MVSALQTAKARLRRSAKAATNAVIGWLAVAFMRGLRKLNVHSTSDRLGRLMRRIGPWLPEHRTGRANLAAAFPEKSPDEIETILGGVWENLGRVAGEFANIDQLMQLDLTDLENSNIESEPATLERFLKLRDDGKGALIFAAHLGNWELPALIPPAQGMRSAVLFRPPNVPAVRRAVEEARAANMGTLIATTADAPMRIARELSNGVHVGMLVDQYFGRGVDVTFFGRMTKANPMLARLARQVNVPIHGLRVVRKSQHRFWIELTEEITPVRDASGDIDIQQTMQVITSVIEDWIRQYPDQWLWLHRRWR